MYVCIKDLCILRKCLFKGDRCWERAKEHPVPSPWVWGMFNMDYSILSHTLGSVCSVTHCVIDSLKNVNIGFMEVF